MVCEKNRTSSHDFERDPIRWLRQEEWIGAQGTTLGADNGIGVAAALAVAADSQAVHGPMEILITVDEETGLNGAKRLSPEALKGRYLLNLDTEEDGVFCIGCAGGVDTNGSFVVPVEPVAPAGKTALFVRIGGLKGGHSGMDIHLGRANAIKLLARLLHELAPLSPRIAYLQGGQQAQCHCSRGRSAARRFGRPDGDASRSAGAVPAAVSERIWNDRPRPLRERRGRAYARARLPVVLGH